MPPRNKVHSLPPELKQWLDGELVRRGFSDYVQPQPSSWNSLIHIQVGQAWTALDTQEWQAISPNQRKPQG